MINIPLCMRDIGNLRQVNPDYKKQGGQIKFSKIELRHILIAVLVLSLAFTILRLRMFWHPEDVYMQVFAVCVVVVVFSFLIHELGHKFVAQRYGAWSEFRAYPMGLLMAMVSALIGFLFAAPGAVYVHGNITHVENGKISLAGPATNFIVAGIVIAVLLVVDIYSMPFWIGFTMFQLAYLNAFLGLFNLIPIPPFDGSKIVKWSINSYIMAVVIGVIELGMILFYIQTPYF